MSSPASFRPLVIVGTLSLVVGFVFGRATAPRGPALDAPQALSASPRKSPPAEPLVVMGAGEEASRIFELEATTYAFKMSHAGTKAFVVQLVDESGRNIGDLANEAGAYNGSKEVRIEHKGRYLLNVQANGLWTVTISPAGS